MERVRMNGVLLAVSAVLLVLCGSGYALKCYSCPIPNGKTCTVNVTCPTTDDACILVHSGTSKLTSCIPYNSCNPEAIGKKFSISSFTYNCCQKELCNRSLMTVVNKTIFSLVTMLALVWICF